MAIAPDLDTGGTLQIHLGDIRNKTALIETARLLRQMAEGFEVQAKLLDTRRNYYGIGKHDISASAKALSYIKKHPEFPNLTASQCRKICDRFSLDYLPNAEILMNAQTIIRREKRAERDARIRKMSQSGVKNTVLARRFKLSTTRISEILRSTL